ncbi:DNA internalization-related competence protein ComEC/Rec2 [uncultured Serinicoccus sp.]|uniref:DNA internalization-related competence protein ComEC/Rec2 n=1 Tax=uncultured Serinicoccus sp. TaxID=735514 RepID=UPI00260BFADA|nr:DNA internalization-related competence protein ComEC/Rec2 [uncultured Serinicoccus sp.]
MPHDARLLLPAVTAWAVLVGVLPGPGALSAVVAGGALTVAVALLVLPRIRGPLRGAVDGPPYAHRGGRSAGWAGGASRSGRRGRPVLPVLALAAAAVGLVCGAAALHLAVARAGPVAGWAQERAVTSVELVVTTEPRVLARADEREPLVVLEARVVRASARGQTARPRTPVLLFAPAGQGWEEAAWRSRVEAFGRWSPAEPGDRAVAVLVPRGPPTTLDRPTALLRGVDHVRDRFRRSVDPLPADARGLVPGLVIGDTSLTPPDLTQAMRDTGMTHLSAVSGSNVAIVAGGVVLLAARLGLPRRWRLPVVLAALLGFILLCRPEPSVLRAGVMGAVGLMALTGGRRRASLPTLGAAVIFLLYLDPWLARSYGFALSTLATLGLVLWARPWGLAMAARVPRWAALPARAAAVPLAAQVICAPVIVLLQGTVTTVAVLANLAAAPLVPPTTILGVVAALLAPLSIRLATAVAWLAAAPAWAIGRIARVCSRLPGGTLEWWDGVVGAWALAAVTLAVLLSWGWWSHQLSRRPWVAVAAGCAVLGWVAPLPGLQEWPPPGWVVVGCDVGQGDAFVVPSGAGRAVVVDTGPDPSAMADCLRSLGVRRVELLVLTHFHSDHVGGLPAVLGAADVDEVLVTPVQEPAQSAASVADQVSAAGIPLRVAQPGDRWTWGDTVVTVLWPTPRPPAGDSAANNASIVLDVEVSGARVLMTGDLEPESARLVARVTEGRDYDVLKVAHHGSAAQDEGLVREARPEIALIGVGEDNDFGHPAPSALSLLSEVGAVVLRTDLHGDVAVVRDARGRLVPHAREGG